MIYARISAALARHARVAVSRENDTGEEILDTVFIDAFDMISYASPPS